MSSEFSSTDYIIKRAIVLAIDRIGGNFELTSSKADGRAPGLPTPRFSLKVRFTGRMDSVDKQDRTFTVLPLLDAHIFSIPERGETVWCMKDKDDKDSDWYYIGRENPLISKKNKFEEIKARIDQPFEESGGGWAIKEAIQGGSEVKWMEPEKEYDKNPNHDYEHPLVRFKPGDVIMQGRNNTLIHHSFNGHRPVEKRKGYIEIVTERDYIYKDVKEHKDRFLEPEDKRYDRWEQQNCLGSRIMIATDWNIDRRCVNWFTEKEWKPSKKIDEGGPNVGRRFDIHYRDEGPSRLSTNFPDGDYPVIPKRDEKQREHIADWKEPANTNEGELYNDPLGVEIEDLSKTKGGIYDSEKKDKNISLKENRTFGAYRGVWNNKRDTGHFDDSLLLFDGITGRARKRLQDLSMYEYIKESRHSRNEDWPIFDSQVPSLYLESENIYILSRSGKDINHAVLGEELTRYLIRLLLDNDHLARTVDLLTTRLNTLALDFAQHTHPTCPPGPNTPPSGGFRGVAKAGGTGSQWMASPEHFIFNTIKNVIPTTAPEKVSGNDSGSQVEEDGSGDAGPSNMAKPGLTVRKRLQDFRKRINQRILELPDILSNRISIN
jgi:hypothetical protein